MNECTHEYCKKYQYCSHIFCMKEYQSEPVEKLSPLKRELIFPNNMVKELFDLLYKDHVSCTSGIGHFITDDPFKNDSLAEFMTKPVYVKSLENKEIYTLKTFNELVKIFKEIKKNVTIYFDNLSDIEKNKLLLSDKKSTLVINPILVKTYNIINIFAEYINFFHFLFFSMCHSSKKTYLAEKKKYDVNKKLFIEKKHSEIDTCISLREAQLIELEKINNDLQLKASDEEIDDAERLKNIKYEIRALRNSNEQIDTMIFSIQKQISELNEQMDEHKRKQFHNSCEIQKLEAQINNV